LSLIDLPVSVPLQTSTEPVTIVTHGPGALDQYLPRWTAYIQRGERVALSRHPGWLRILEKGLGHRPYCLEAMRGDNTCGLLPLAEIKSLLFGRFLVALPYLNSGGVSADDDISRRMLIEAGAKLADQLGVRYLELRHEQALEHTALTHCKSDKVHMRLQLPGTPGKLWDQLSAKVRNQVRKGQKHELTVSWGGVELLDPYYAVFSENMRDLGTPVYGRKLFRAMLDEFPGETELCVVRLSDKPVAGAVLLHGKGVTEIPSASSLRRHNSTNANMLMYWHALERAVERGQSVFDFGRSTRDSNTYRFKKQWGAEPEPALWQYYLRSGTVGDMRPDNPRYQRFIRMWQRLPLWLTRFIGPMIVRGIP
jgi:FemAB-related protein (PEP-CTERM system-associated)